MITMDAPATEKQIAFIVRLMEERGIEVPDMTDLTKAGASVVIDGLKSQPRKTVAPTTPAVEIEDGMYVLDGKIFKVQHAVHGSGHQYAKQLIPPRGDERAEFVYAPGVVSRLTPDHKMTKEEAREFGALYGTCVRCGAILTAEDSIDRMMGPVCFGKMGF